MGSPVRVRRAKAMKADLAYPMTVHADDGDHIVVIGPYSGTVPLDLGYVIFEPTDTFIEHFWRTRWYSIAAVHDREMAPKGWYCDVTRPTIVGPDEIVSHDLELDVWQPAGPGAALTLDEDEFAARELHRTDRDAHRSALAALDELVRSSTTRFASLL